MADGCDVDLGKGGETKRQVFRGQGTPEKEKPECANTRASIDSSFLNGATKQSYL